MCVRSFIHCIHYVWEDLKAIGDQYIDIETPNST